MIENFKILILCVLCLAFSNSIAQETRHLYEDTLSIDEQNTLNEIFKDYRGEKDFSQMKIAFFSSPGGTVQRFHEDYFSVVEFKHLDNGLGLGYLIFFSDIEKEKHGYDVAIVYESKNNQPRLNRRMIKTKKDYLKQRNAHNIN